MKVNDYVYHTNLIPKTVCEDVLKEIQKRKWTNHEWHTNIGNKKSQDKRELDVQQTDAELQNKLSPFIIDAVGEYIDRFKEKTKSKEFLIIHQFSPIRFNKYSTGTIMRKHYDHIHSIFDGERKGIPILSVLGFLNDDYEGGQLKVRNKIHKVRQGSFIIFPSCFVYPHQVEEVTKGTRYSFISWGF